MFVVVRSATVVSADADVRLVSLLDNIPLTPYMHYMSTCRNTPGFKTNLLAKVILMVVSTCTKIRAVVHYAGVLARPVSVGMISSSDFK